MSLCSIPPHDAEYRVGHLSIVAEYDVRTANIVLTCPELKIDVRVPEKALVNGAKRTIDVPVFIHNGSGIAMTFTPEAMRVLRAACDDPQFFDKVEAVAAAYESLEGKGTI